MPKATLGPLVSDVRGKLGEEVVLRGRAGTTLRRRPTYKYPVRPSQQAAQQRMKTAMLAWNTLTREQARAWSDYAQTLLRHNPLDGQAYHPTGFNAFSGLAMKFLQINPTETVPLTPPATAFYGDALTVRVAGGAGRITFLASGPNTPPAQTELLLQRLKTPRRAPVAFYKSEAFVTFTAGTRSHAVTIPAGHYACACRFVHALTGQETPLLPVGVVQVT